MHGLQINYFPSTVSMIHIIKAILSQPKVTNNQYQNLRPKNYKSTWFGEKRLTLQR